MKITLDIADPLLNEAKVFARAHKTTVRALIERGLQLALAECEGRSEFKLRDASVGGQGLHPDATGKSWDEIRDLTLRRPWQ